jgi:uncharacterized protein YqjF (DUF2071 family)
MINFFAEEDQMPENRPFLTADWRYLLILNYEVDPDVLAPLIPAGTQLDLCEGKALISVVGFLFQKTRVFGVPIPFHINFEEVNLRFYVRRSENDDPRRGVVFVKEIVPRIWIARIARWLYGENYVALPMQHKIEQKSSKLCPEGLVEYAWRYKGRVNRLGGLALGDPTPLVNGSVAEFITEHYWGYTRLGKNKTGIYQVQHPAWRVWNVAQPYLLCDVKALYGDRFEPFLRQRPHSAFLAEGSPISVYPGAKIKLI